MRYVKRRLWHRSTSSKFVYINRVPVLDSVGPSEKLATKQVDIMETSDREVAEMETQKLLRLCDIYAYGTLAPNEVRVLKVDSVGRRRELTERGRKCRPSAGRHGLGRHQLPTRIDSDLQTSDSPQESVGRDTSRSILNAAFLIQHLCASFHANNRSERWTSRRAAATSG